MKTSYSIKPTPQESRELRLIVRRQKAPHRKVVRARIILLLSRGESFSETARKAGVARRIAYKWAKRFLDERMEGLEDQPRSGRPARFSPMVAAYLTKLACELPDTVDRSLSLWTCAELARTLERDGIVERMSPQTVQRLLQSSRLKPWRVHHWLSPKVPRDEAFRELVLNLCDLYTRESNTEERILSFDELTSIQPRTRSCVTKPARPGLKPVLVEHEYERKGAWNLFAAFDTQTGEVIAQVHKRKRQKETIALFQAIEEQTPDEVKTIHVICDNISIHRGKLVRQWLQCHRRFEMHHTPVHCSWMNQVEQWFSILRRKRLAAPNFADLDDLAYKLARFIDEWNEMAHPFHWTASSFSKILEKLEDGTPFSQAA